jgi:hypothetical protein
MTRKKVQKNKVAKKKAGAKRGPKPEVLKLEGDWRELMKQSLQKKKPKDGWPS